MILYAANIGVFSQEQMTAAARLELKAHSQDVSLLPQSLCALGRHAGLQYHLFKYKYMIKAAAGYTCQRRKCSAEEVVWASLFCCLIRGGL